jgi:hypothetical protein
MHTKSVGIITGYKTSRTKFVRSLNRQTEDITCSTIRNIISRGFIKVGVLLSRNDTSYAIQATEANTTAANAFENFL